LINLNLDANETSVSQRDEFNCFQQQVKRICSCFIRYCHFNCIVTGAINRPIKRDYYV